MADIASWSNSTEVINQSPSGKQCNDKTRKEKKKGSDAYSYDAPPHAHTPRGGEDRDGVATRQAANATSSVGTTAGRRTADHKRGGSAVELPCGLSRRSRSKEKKRQQNARKTKPKQDRGNKNPNRNKRQGRQTREEERRWWNLSVNQWIDIGALERGCCMEQRAGIEGRRSTSAQDGPGIFSVQADS